MLIIPAIDLKDGKIVRLTRGDFEQVEEYDLNPVETAQKFVRDGAKCIHVVDLSGALEGHFRKENLDVLRDIVSTVSKEGVCVQFGGGIRSLHDIKYVFEYTKVSRIILGTLAQENINFLKEAILEYKEKIIVSLDARESFLVKKGWTEQSKIDIRIFLQKLEAEEIALKMLIYTDITRDGTLEGPDFDRIENILDLTEIPVIASGGISSLEDLKRLKSLEYKGLYGVIVGKALYKGKVDLAKAIKEC